MLSTIKLKKDFDAVSSTGSSVIILKKNKKCDCYDPTELLDSEPNPYCEKCFGTGYTRKIILTEKIRHEPYSDSRSLNLENTLYNTSINDYRIFFMPQLYSFLSTEDLIVVIDGDNKDVTSLYKIVNKERYNADDFVYYEIFGKKIVFSTEMKFGDLWTKKMKE